MRYERHIFICTNERPAGHPKGCCKEKGSPRVLAALKSELKEHDLQSSVRANASGCLDACEFGVSAVVYPDGVWYAGLTAEDAREIVESHIVGGVPVERLRIADERYTPKMV